MRGGSSRHEYAVLDRGSACLQCKRRKKVRLCHRLEWHIIYLTLHIYLPLSAAMVPSLFVVHV